MKYQDEVSDLRWQRKILIGVIGLVAVFGVWGQVGWTLATLEGKPTFIPPDLSDGALVHAGEVPPSTAFDFAARIWQQINRWKKNGREDYPGQILAYQAYLTPRFREELLADMRQRASAGDLDNRERGLQLTVAYEPERVTPLDGQGSDAGDASDASVWVVVLDTELREWYLKTEVKSAAIRYSLRVVAVDIDRHLNPYGLMLDGFAEPPGPVPGERDSKPVLSQRTDP